MSSRIPQFLDWPLSPPQGSNAVLPPHCPTDFAAAGQKT